MDPICPTDCTTSLPVVSFDTCNPEVQDAQIDRIYLTNVGNPLTDWTQVSEWNGRLDQTGTASGDEIRYLNVIGDKPKPSANIRDISLKRKIIGQKDHTINFIIDEMNAVNHEFIRQLECGGNFLVWYRTCGGLLFGGNSGIEGFVEADMVIPQGADEIITGEGTITWKARFTEERIVSPI